MREITTHKCSDLNESINIVADDELGPGGANHRYRILVIDRFGSRNNTTYIKFQKGAVKDVGLNGISDEALLAVIRDRLASFQAGPFACNENESALELIDMAIGSLKARTLNRIERGVEGHSKK